MMVSERGDLRDEERCDVWVCADFVLDVPNAEGEEGRRRDGTGGRGAGGDITRQLEVDGLPREVARAAV